MTKKSLLLLSTVCILTAASAQNNSLLWEISGNGLSKPSYLYGTMHVSSKIAFHLTDSFFVALKSADVIALESNPETWIESDYGENGARADEDYYGYSDYYDYTDFYSKATEIDIPDAKTYTGAFADNSWLINGYLYRYNDYHGDYEEETYLDLFIFQCGRKLGKDIASLEREQEVLKLLQKAYGPSEDEEEDKDYIEQRKLMNDLYEDGTNVYEQIDEAYRSGDLEKLDSLERLTSPSKHYHKFFIDDRNANMARRMDSIMQQGKVIFTGIGAAHLPGEAGVINRLREMGYSVHPVKGKITGKSIKEKEHIDAINYTHGTSRQYANDSLFSVMSPGKLYNIPNEGNDWYLFPDMANSAYYTVERIRHHAALKGETADDVLKDIDDLLFENIPGDMVSKSVIHSNTGIPGYDIITKTKRGNLIHYQIYVTPLETIIFKAGGIGDFITQSKEAQGFFSSVQFTDQQANKWVRYTPDWGIFSLELPDNQLTETLKDKQTIYFNDQMATGEAADADRYYWFSAYYYNDDDFIEKDSFELKHLSNVFAEQFKKNKYEQTKEKYYTVNDHPGYSAEFKGKDNYLFTQVVIQGPYYIIMAALSGQDTAPEKYFGSLELLPIRYIHSFETYTDTSLDFTVRTIPPAIDTLLSFDDINYYDSYDYGYYEGNEKEDRSYLPSTKVESFESDDSPEIIMVRYFQSHKFYSAADKDKFWKHLEKSEAGYADKRVSRKKYTETDGIQSLELLLTDTASTRGILVKYVLKSTVTYRLSTTIDTLAPLSPFISEFYSSFTPTDSVSGRSVFESPTALYFSQLNSSDSLLHAQAVNSVGVYRFTGSDIDSLQKFITSPAFLRLDMSDREAFIDELAHHPNSRTTEILKNIYLRAGDTSYLQLSALHGLALLKTKEATKVFTDLLYIETPLVQKGSSVSWIFNPYYDTLEIAAQLFPALFDFVSFPEYQFGIYKLMALIEKNDSADAKFFPDRKKMIISAANADLKRNLIKTMDNEKYTSYSYYRNNNYFPLLKNLSHGNRYQYYNIYDDWESGDYSYDLSDYSQYSISDLMDNYEFSPSLMLPGRYDDLSAYGWATGVLDYYTILLTDYKDDPAVKKYFDKIYHSSDDALIYRTSLTLMADSLNVPDSVWTNLLKDREWRYYTISKLKMLKYTHQLDTTYTTQLSITEGCLYQYNFKSEEDSVQYIRREKVTTPSGEGYVYFYKSKIGNDKGWNLDCIGIQPLDDTKYEIEPLFVDYGGLILDDEDLEKKISNILSSVEMIGHNRVHIKDDRYSDYGYMNDY